MNDNPEFDLETEWLEPAPPKADVPAESAATPADPPKPAEPVVVIQYRNRGISPILLFPITLVASLGLFAGYHHFFVRPIFPTGGMYPPPTPTAGPSSNSASSERLQLDADLDRVAAALPATPSTPAPLTLESQPLPAGYHLPPARPRIDEPKPAGYGGVAPATGADAVAWPGAEAVASTDPPRPATPAPPVEPEKPAEEPKKEAPPISIASTALDKVETPPADVVAQAPAEPLPTQEQMMERIQQEAELEAARQRELDRRRQEAVAQHEADAAQRVEDERAQFRKALQDILSVGGPDVGKAIDELCDKFGRGYTPELKTRVGAALAHYKGKLTRDGEIRLLRVLGVPEPGILDYLSNRVHRSINSRNGPRDPGEVRIFAARQLLRSTGSGTPSAAAPDSGSQTPARSSSVRRTTLPTSTR